MRNMIFKQERALKGRILSAVLLILAIVVLFTTSDSLFSRVTFLAIALVVFGFSVSYKINEEFKNEKLYSFFGITLFKTKLDVSFPDYISVFSASFGLDNEWGSIAAIGTKERHDKFVIRFFKGNQKFTLYKTSNYQVALQRANELSDVLNVEVYDNVKE